MEIIELLDEGFGWTTDRVRYVRRDGLDAATPCTAWNLRTLLNHTLGTIDVLAWAVSGDHVLTQAGAHALATEDRLGDEDPADAFVRRVDQARTAWQAQGALDRECATEMGPIPARSAAGVSLLEVVVHGWDIGRSTGEDVPIPPQLAEPVLAFARQWPPVEMQRGSMYALPIAGGGSPSDQLLRHLGRQP
ncbi:TIGR03086 family metal-binding protein [Micromonospora sp. RP3T]|uniref:TIGR03086 family metal-binding protein n=1 Tax=Micromonospora sp. RP3T TaxID=2135446 RepID=UPI000D169677|nr:TIGR03086 family metal-binding protein [Micromonospora sp. RP3T]PTA42376.1 TIGR03086 family protein [Micromonospora sp. RP3T]